MKRTKWLVLGVAALVSVCGTTGLATAQDAAAPVKAEQKAPVLKVGDKAPAVKVVKFVKGKEFKEFEAGNVYVVEFWATWCGPCKKSIPHLTEVQKEYKDKKVTVLGVSVWEETGGLEKVVPFVEKMGEKMDYTVAYDGDDGEMAKTWLKAAGRNGIPSAFIVDQKGTVAWIGHPMDNMDTVLAEVVAGTYDVKAAAEKEAKKADGAKKIKTLQKSFESAMESGTSAEVIAAAEAILTVDSAAYGRVAAMAFENVLITKKDPDSAYAFASKWTEKDITDKMVLNEIAWTTLDDPAVPRRDLDLAMKIAEKAVKASNGKDGAILDTLARAHFEKGDLAKAIEIQKSAVELADDSMKSELEATLKKYEDAKAAK